MDLYTSSSVHDRMVNQWHSLVAILYESIDHFLYPYCSCSANKPSNVTIKIAIINTKCRKLTKRYVHNYYGFGYVVP